MNNTTPSHSAQIDSLLFEHFATLATAPDGIARLRELILQLAVLGKLGTQDAKDEPASVLLKKIRKDKEQLVKGGKIKRDKQLEPVKNSHVGFQIPDTWVLTRLGNIAQYNAETKTSANEISEEAWVFDLEDIEKDTSRILQKVRFKDRQSLSTKSRFRKGDILYGKLRPYLNKVVVADEDGYCTTEIVPIRPYGNIFPTFLMYALKTPDFLSYVNSKTYGIKMPRLGTADALNTIIPLPPLAEQHRIVAKVDRLMALCDQLEARQQQERAGCLKLGTASLTGLQNATHPEEFGRLWAQVCDAFDLILDCPENVAVLRQTILQLAVQGRLVRQEPGDEPASKLVERIRKEKERLLKEGKIKREKPLKPIGDIPFNIPKQWVWEKLGNCVPKITDGEHFRPNTVKNGVMFLSAKDIRENYVDFSDPLFVDECTAEICRQRCNPECNDILVVSRGAGVGRCCIISTNELFCLLGSVILIKNSHLIDSKYLLFSLKSSIINNQITSLSANTAQQALYIRDIKDALIPLPPLAEQHRIVAKVDALMALCDELEARLMERAVVQGKLAGAVVKGATIA